jgi:hypothetical protein
VRGRGLVLLILFAATAHAREPPLPVPPIPPAEPPPLPAPVPDLNIVLQDRDGPRLTVTLDNEINHRAAPDPGYAFAPGAQYQLDNDRRFFVLPGFMVHVPLP